MHSEEDSLCSVYNSLSSQSNFTIECPACAARLISDKRKNVPELTKGSNVKDKIKYFSGTPSSSDVSFDSFKECESERNISLNSSSRAIFYKSRTEILNTKNGI